MADEKMRWLNFLFVPLFVLIFSTSCSESVDTKRLAEANADILKDKLSMSVALEILNNSQSRNKIRTYFNKKSNLYNLVAEKQQGEMLVEGYSVLDINSPIIGYSLFLQKRSGQIAILDASVNPLNTAAMDATSQLICKSLDFVDSGGGAKLYFLGLYDIGEKHIIKIMVRETKISQGSEYAIRYAASSK